MSTPAQQCDEWLAGVRKHKAETEANVQRALESCDVLGAEISGALRDRGGQEKTRAFELLERLETLIRGE